MLEHCFLKFVQMKLCMGRSPVGNIASLVPPPPPTPTWLAFIICVCMLMKHHARSRLDMMGAYGGAEILFACSFTRMQESNRSTVRKRRRGAFLGVSGTSGLFHGTSGCPGDVQGGWGIIHSTSDRQLPVWHAQCILHIESSSLRIWSACWHWRRFQIHPAMRREILTPG